jgi:hypothetical protein
MDAIDNAGIAGLTGLELCLFLLAFRDRPDAGAEAAGRSIEEIHKRFWRPEETAHIRGTFVSAVRFSVDRHNFATLFYAGHRRSTAGHSKFRSVPDRESLKRSCQNVAKDLGNTGAFRDLRSRIN